MMPPQRITNRRDSRIGVDRLASGQYFSNTQGAHAVSSFQPSLAFLFIDLDDLLGHPVDIREQRLGDPRNDHDSCIRRDVDPLQLAQCQTGETTLPQSVNADQNTDRKTLLRDSTRLFKRRRGRLDAFDRRVVAQRVQSGCHVALDACISKRELRFITQVGNLITKRRRDRRHHLGQPVPQTGREFRDPPANLDITRAIRSTLAVRAGRCPFARTSLSRHCFAPSHMMAGVANQKPRMIAATTQGQASKAARTRSGALRSSMKSSITYLTFTAAIRKLPTTATTGLNRSLDNPHVVAHVNATSASQTHVTRSRNTDIRPPSSDRARGTARPTTGRPGASTTRRIPAPTCAGGRRYRAAT